MDSGLLADGGAADTVYVATGCGDGIVVPPEQCDDGNTVAGDGCSPTCKVETGHKCSGSPSVCSATVCGDGVVEGTEGCDDGNTMPFDGCSEDCRIELDCSGASCISKCGDGIVVPPEQCDDGNTVAGDGCSTDCKVEAGWICTQPQLGDKMLVPVIYRDFRYHNPSDFEAGVVGQTNASTGMVKIDLDTDGKPVYANPASPGGAVHVASTASFATWFRTSTASPPVNHATASKLALWNNGQGAYVNRYGPNGEQWNVTQIAYWCGTVGQGEKDATTGKEIPCTSLASGTDCEKMEALGYTQLKCYTDTAGTTYQALYVVAKVDGNPLFFPIDADPLSADQLEAAQVPSVPLGLYDASGTWPWDVDAAGNKRLHNFSFTSEARYRFLYDKSKTYTLNFASDEDMWVFINKQLAVDLGGIHPPVVGSITLDATTASGLNLVDGKIYEVAVFHAERQTNSSAYEMTLIGFNAAPSDCTPCGNASMPGDGGCSNATGAAGAGGVAGPTGTTGTSGTGGATGGATGVSTGGTGVPGGASSSGGSTAATPPSSDLEVWVIKKTTQSTGQIALDLRIDNKTSTSVDMSTVVLRYWYQDEGLGTALVLSANYVSIGFSTQGKVTSGIAVAAPSPIAGADHYVELSFSGTLAAQGDKSTNDQFTVQVNLHTASYTGTVDVTNDYSYDGGAEGLYENKITLYESSKLVWGVEP
jgi:fibro-slime domain-containing protein